MSQLEIQFTSVEHKVTFHVVSFPSKMNTKLEFITFHTSDSHFCVTCHVLKMCVLIIINYNNSIDLFSLILHAFFIVFYALLFVNCGLFLDSEDYLHRLKFMAVKGLRLISIVNSVVFM